MERAWIVADVMTQDVITVTPDSSIGAALMLMHDGGFRRLPVVEDGRLVGIVTDRDLRQATDSPLVLREKWYSDFLLDSIKVKACMTSNPITVVPATTILDAARELRQHKFGGLPVVEEDRVVGIVTITDMLDCLIRMLEREPAGPGQETRASTG